MSNRIVVFIALAFVAASGVCCSSAEGEMLQEIEAAVSRAEALGARSSTAAAVSAYQEAIDAVGRYLDQYPDGARANEMRGRLAMFSAALRSLREDGGEYQIALTKELDEGKAQLPSDCRRMAEMWQHYLDRFPGSGNAETARQKRLRWDAKLKEEINRGFQIILEEAEVEKVKGPSHGLMAGRPWDPEIFGCSTPPDPYAVLLVNSQPAGYTLPARDTCHPVWHKQSDVLTVSDEQEVSIVVRDRDVAEKATVLLLGHGLFTFSGAAAAAAAIKRDDDDDICRWVGSIHELIESGEKRLTYVGDCRRLRARVVRP
ncbi:MAG TPA: C2 domain-containing protein [Blastocatellia bacterium]|nr:C2 domain-containing protein [Blastocatellia bacterium]